VAKNQEDTIVTTSLIIIIVIAVLLIGFYTWTFLWTRKRQKKFDAQYTAAKERHEVFVLNKKIVKERPQSGLVKFIKVKTYQVTGRVNVSQAVKGVQMSRMQTVTFHTTKQEYEKIQGNHKYKMDIAGNYIGYVIAPPPQKEKKSKKTAGQTKATPSSGKKTKSK
jgi:cbb3-type cytochrome oxidase maturation protein